MNQHGQADAILAANVMCHISYLPSVLDGFRVLLKPTGIAAFEDPYLGDVIEKTSYDQVYDEHMYLFSASAIARLAARHDLELIDAISQVTHGGSMRYVLAHKGARPVSSRAEELIQHEEAQGLLRPETFDKFRENCEQSREDLISVLTKLKFQNKRVVGYAATSKSTTVINYCGITPDLIEFISDTTPIKQGKFSPGKHIPVLDHQKFCENYPDIALLFAWNHKKEILANEQAFVAAGGKWLEFVPRVRIS